MALNPDPSHRPPSQEAVLRAALGEVEEAIEVIDPESMAYVYVNEACARLHELPLDVLRLKGLRWVTARWNTSTHEELRQRFQQLVQQQPRAHTQVHEAPTEGSGPRWIEVTSRAVDVEGRWLIVVVSRDITHQRKSEHRLQVLDAVLNHAPDSMLVIDPEALEFLDVNEAAAKLHGHSREEMLQLGLDGQRRRLGLWSQDDLRQRYRGLIEHYPRITKEVLSWPGDRAVEFRRRAVPLDEQWLIVSVVRDVTDRKAAERRLQWLMAAIDQAADAILVVDPDSGEYLYVNDASVRLYDLSREVMMDRGVMWVTRYLHIWTEAEQREQFRQLIGLYPQPISTVLPLQRAGRDTVWIETTARALEMDGKWLVVTMARDITERKAADRKVQLLFAAVNQAPDAIMIVDPEALEFIDFNEGCARMAGLTREELLCMGLRKMNDLGRNWSAAELRERYDALIASHPRPDTETREWHMPGQPVLLLETTRRAVKVEGKWVIITVSRDVTERERAGQDMAAHVVELARSNRELEQFANVTSHDLSEPLRMVASFTQLLARRYHAQLDDEGREYIGYIVSGARRMKQLIDDLLFYSKAGRPDAQTQCAPLDLALDAALENLAHAMADSSALIRRPAALPTLRYERTGMTQVFQNLVSNALKFRRADAPVTVTITAQCSQAEWTIAVADNGIGVDPAYFDRIFVIFQRLHSREEYEGTGIGLAICEKIVERHGGRIWVEAAGPEGGACFKFTLPLKVPVA